MSRKLSELKGSGPWAQRSQTRVTDCDKASKMTKWKKNQMRKLKRKCGKKRQIPK